MIYWVVCLWKQTKLAAGGLFQRKIKNLKFITRRHAQIKNI